MSRLFMYGTRLQEFEQMMMLVPNFTKRGKGLIVLKGFPFTEEDVACRFCTEYPKCKNDDSKCLVLSERLKANAVCYESIVKNTFKDFREYTLKKRLSKLILGFNGDFFCDSSHRHRFENIIKKLMELTGLSRSVFSKPHIRDLFEKGDKKTVVNNSTQKKTKDEIIKALRQKNAELEREINF